MRSTRSSGSSSADGGQRPSRTAIAIVAFLSVAVPAGLLTLIVTHDDDQAPPPDTTPTRLEPTDAAKARVGSSAPDFTLSTTEGKTVTLSALRGRPVVIVFFASWCHPCEEEMPVLQQFQDELGGRLEVIGVSFHDLASDSRDFVRRLRVTYPALLDAPDGPVADRYGVRGIPQTVFVDGRGVVRGRVYGETSRRALQPAISDLLSGKNVRPV